MSGLNDQSEDVMIAGLEIIGFSKDGVRVDTGSRTRLIAVVARRNGRCGISVNENSYSVRCWGWHVAEPVDSFEDLLKQALLSSLLL